MLQDVVTRKLEQSGEAIVLEYPTKAAAACSLEVTQATCNGAEGQYKMCKEIYIQGLT